MVYKYGREQSKAMAIDKAGGWPWFIKESIQQAHGTLGELFGFLIENLKNAYRPIARHVHEEIQAALTTKTSALGQIVKESVQQACGTLGELFIFLIEN